MINGSPRKDGNTHLALSEIGNELEKNGVEYEIINIGTKAVQGCIACYKCRELGHCIFKDDLYWKVREAIEKADALIVGSPVYYAGPNGSLCALLDRIFFSCGSMLNYKPGASVAVARRGGTTATFDRLNKYFTIANMPLVSSQYWNNVHGRDKGEAAQDIEGMQIMRTLGKNMAWMLRCIKMSQEPIPEQEPITPTNFIR